MRSLWLSIEAIFVGLWVASIFVKNLGYLVSSDKDIEESLIRMSGNVKVVRAAAIVQVVLLAMMVDLAVHLART